MKNILLILLIMILSACHVTEQPDPYWEFDSSTHFRPQLNQGDYYKLRDYDFAWLVLEPISKFIGNAEQELTRGKSLSYGQKALYYWWYLDAQVTNGGFIQFYANGYGNYVPTIIKGLQYVGDSKMVQLIQNADRIYQENKKRFDEEEELYDHLDELTVLDDDYYELHDHTVSIIEQYIRQHPDEICLNEAGKSLDPNFTGACKTYYEDGNVKEDFSLQSGKLSGEFRSFYENGQLKELSNYEAGKDTGIRKTFDEAGQLTYEAKEGKTKEMITHQWYYSNGHPKKLETVSKNKGEKRGSYNEWYENGNKKLETNFVDQKRVIQNFWDENGKQLLKNGTGLYISESTSLNGNITRDEYRYQDYRLHGVRRSFKDGVLTFYQEMKNGQIDGVTRNYYNNGNLREERVYKNGKQISTKEFPKFQDPVVVTNISCDMKDEWLVNRELPTADQYPRLLNHEETISKLEIDVAIFENYTQDWTLSYNYFLTIDAQGNLTNMDVISASNGFILDQLKESIKGMKFSPAQKEGKSVHSYLILEFDLELGEKK